MTASLLDTAIQIAAKAHAGAIQKNGQPYILHPLRVMMRVHADDEKIVAIPDRRTSSAATPPVKKHLLPEYIAWMHTVMSTLAKRLGRSVP